MAIDERLPTLNGSQELLFSENSVFVARVVAMAQTNLRGAHFTIENAQSVSRLAFGLTLLDFGFGVLAVEGHLFSDEVSDLRSLVKDMIDNRADSELDDIPF